MYGNQVRAVPNASQYADIIVRGLLGNADERRWWSLASELRTLAEVSPDTFMSAIEESLSRENPPVMVLFKEDEGPLFGHAYHSNLLWALETLAWSPEYLSRAAEILARLALLDPEGRYANRPKNSLRSSLPPMATQFEPTPHARNVPQSSTDCAGSSQEQLGT